MGSSERDNLGFALTDWLLDTGASAHKKGKALGDSGRLDPLEQLLHEFWLFDVEQQNGGVAQYFLNRPVSHWNRLYALAQTFLPSFTAFGAKVESLVGQAVDPHEAFYKSSIDFDGLYSNIRISLLQELQSTQRH
jgi:hypothetical protein